MPRQRRLDVLDAQTSFALEICYNLSRFLTCSPQDSIAAFEGDGLNQLRDLKDLRREDPFAVRAANKREVLSLRRIGLQWLLPFSTVLVFWPTVGSAAGAPMTFSQQAGRFLTIPWVAALLLVVGVIALGVEAMKPGVTFPGLLGITSLGLFFLGHVLVGTAGWLEVILAIIGVLLIVVEVFVPGGVFGIAGAVAVAASVFLAVPTPEQAAAYLLAAALAFLVVLFVLIRTIGKRGLGRFLTLEKSAQGWVPPRTDLTTLLGQEGKSLTVLRPAGTAQFGNLKVDVVTEGEFLPAGVSVTVIQVEGTRVVVRQTESPR